MSVQVKFIKKSFQTIQGAREYSTDVAGRIVFDEQSNIIFVNGHAYTSNVTDASITNGVLTINKLDGTSVTVDASSLLLTGYTAPTYDQQSHLSGAWNGAQGVQGAKAAYTVQGSDTIVQGVEKLDSKINALANEVDVNAGHIEDIKDAVGLDNNYEISFNNSLISAQGSVKDAIETLAETVAAQAGGMRYNGAISTATATLNSTTNDIRPGDIYLASDSFTIGTAPNAVEVEAGDLIVYSGATATVATALTTSNCNVIEREDDQMEAAAKTALQAISAQGDSYITVQVGEKTGNDYEKTQGISVTAVTATVTVQGAQGSTPAELEISDNGLVTAQGLNTAVDFLLDRINEIPIWSEWE